MTGLRFKLTRSNRFCCHGHTNTFEIEGADEAFQEWLAGWTLYCDTCKALTLGFGQFRAASRQTRSKGTVGFVVQVPIDMRIVSRGGKL
jgi:hypothetical protein